MTDVVQTQEEAVELAIAFLKDAEAKRKQAFEEAYKHNPQKSYPDVDWNYVLTKVLPLHNGWIMTFFRISEGAVVDPPDVTVRVNRKTGEVQFYD